MSTRPLPTTPSGGRLVSPGGDLVLGRYRLTRRLGAGAFGTVHAARDERLERDVAIKLLPRERILEGRFEREARAAARLQHPAIVTLYEAEVDDEGAYLVSELVRGRTLDAMLAAGRLSDRDVLLAGIALCDALAHAHAAGVIHRDVKPSNVLIAARRRSDAPVAKLTDFGVAHVVGGDALTRTGDVIGTAAYMSPEQASGREAVPESDLYSLALVLYEALTGVNPLHGVTRRARRPGTYLPPVRRQRRDLPRELGAAIDQALRPRCAERGTLTALRAVLVDCLPEIGEAPGVVEPAFGPSGPIAIASDRADPVHPAELWRPSPRGDGAAGLRAGGTEAPPRRGLALARVRILPALAAAATVLWTVPTVLRQPPLQPGALALGAALFVLLMPRLGAILTGAALAAVIAAAGRPGAALVILVVLGLSVAGMLLAGRGWILAAGAVGLGLVGLGGAWPAVAARLGSGPRERAALGATGFLWLATAGALAGHRLYWIAPHTPPPSAWGGSLSVAVREVVVRAAHPELAVGLLAWGLAAAAAPYLLGGRRAALDLLGAAVVSLATVIALRAGGVVHLHGMLAGAAVGGLVLMLQSVAKRPRGPRSTTGAAR